MKVGDKLKALEFHRDMIETDYVTITGVDVERAVYFWEAKNKGKGKVKSGYFFKEAVKHEEE